MAERIEKVPPSEIEKVVYLKEGRPVERFLRHSKYHYSGEAILELIITDLNNKRGYFIAKQKHNNFTYYDEKELKEKIAIVRKELSLLEQGLEAFKTA